MIKSTLSSVAALVVVTLAFNAPGCSKAPPEDAPAPLVPRLVEVPASEAQLLTDAVDLLSYSQQETPVIHVDTGRARLPNQLAASMMPILVDWEREPASVRMMRVKNVNVAGNPIVGHNVLATVDVPLDGVRRAEWCLTPPRNESNWDAEGGHGQLRFLFDPALRPVVLDESGAPMPGVAAVDDLIVSWEAWRPPLVRWTAKDGLDPESYALTLRVYTGAKRFLDDAVRNNPWNCYPLNLPGEQEGAVELLYAGLLMGDALARRTIREMLEVGQVQLTDVMLEAMPPAAVARATQVFSESSLPEDPLVALIGGADLSYQLIRRSCVTHSLYTVQIGLQRIYGKLGLGEAPRLEVVPEDLPEWVDGLAGAERGDLLALLPGALLYVARNATVLPSNAHKILDAQGLIEKDENGDLIRYYYHRGEATPWGPIRDNMM
ncbi:MAG: hypothetical protein EP301_08835 [Gammaproteobacteria bacterium]|nr:MAG: hypothetical protein EP301_08835 [Gammaproteobacteria bacterium]